MRGDQALRSGRLADAIADYRRAVEAAPALADIWFNLGWALRASGEFAPALEAYAMALKQGIAQPAHVHLNRAAILSDQLFQPEAALDELRLASAMDPDLHEARLGIARILEDLNDVEGAADAYRQILARAPRHGVAVARLAMIDVMRGDAVTAAATLKAAVGQAADLDERAEILFALGAALDALGDYDDAFQAYQAANWCARAQSSAPYDRRAQERLVEETIAAFPDAGSIVGKLAPAEGMATPPMFICGMFRSGSTLAEQIITRHPATLRGGELEYLPALVRSLPGYPADWQATDPHALAVLHKSYSALAGARIVTDKRCDNFAFIGLIKATFPTARIVHTHREALDNILSVYFLNFGDAISYSTELTDIAHYYLQYRRLTRHWQHIFPDDIVDLDYDALVRDPDGVIGRALQPFGLDWQHHYPRAEQDSRPIRTASNLQARRPLHAKSSGRWRHYERHLGEVIAMLKDAGL